MGFAVGDEEPVAYVIRSTPQPATLNRMILESCGVG